MIITNERPFNGGTLIITEVPAQKCDCDEQEQILLGDGALMAGYAKFLSEGNIIGNVIVSLSELKQRYSLQDFLPKSVG